MLKKYKQYFIAWGQPDGETDNFKDAMLLIDKLPEEQALLKKEEREKTMQSIGIEFVGYEQVLTEVEL